jgi:hypothetical protein
MDLAAWKNAFKLDPASTFSAVLADKPEALRFEYATAEAASVPLKGSWKDMSGTEYREPTCLTPRRPIPGQPGAFRFPAADRGSTEDR